DLDRLDAPRVGELGGPGRRGQLAVVPAPWADPERSLVPLQDKAAAAPFAGDAARAGDRLEPRSGCLKRPLSGCPRSGEASQHQTASHSQATAPQVAPAPKAATTTLSPRLK